MESIRSVASSVKGALRDLTHTTMNEFEKAWQAHAAAWESKDVEALVAGFSPDGVYLLQVSYTLFSHTRHLPLLYVYRYPPTDTPSHPHPIS